MDNKIRLHLPAIPHTITTNEFSHCAFTGKVLRFGLMMINQDYEVYHYGVETSESNATKQIDLFTKEEWDNLRILSYQELHPSLTRDDIQERLSDPKKFVGDLANASTSLYKQFNQRFRVELQKHYRNTSTDIVCIPFGRAYQEALMSLNVIVVETGIGYDESFATYRIVESYAHMHYICCVEKIVHPSNYWFNVPNYYDITEWPFVHKPKKPKIGYYGRICQIKGLDIFIEISKTFNLVEFVMCGQGDPEPFLKQGSDTGNLKYKPPIHGKERGEF